MIPHHARLEVAWVDPAELRPDPPQVMDMGQVAYYVRMMSESPELEGHYAPPMVNARSMTFRDGRHRWMAHLVLARPRIRVILVHGDEPVSYTGTQDTGSDQPG